MATLATTLDDTDAIPIYIHNESLAEMYSAFNVNSAFPSLKSIFLAFLQNTAVWRAWIVINDHQSIFLTTGGIPPLGHGMDQGGAWG